MQTAKNLEILQCRICYDSAFNLRQLTNLPENCPSRIASGKTYAQLLLEVCNINVMDDMPLGKWPQFICLNCSHKLILAHDFIHQTHQVNNRLKSMANLMKTSEESVFIEKPALDIPLEFKIEKEEDDDLLNEREFLYSPIEAEALNARTPLPSKENCAQSPSNNYILKELKNNITDTENIKEIFVTSNIEFIGNDIITKVVLDKFQSNIKDDIDDEKPNHSTQLPLHFQRSHTPEVINTKETGPSTADLTSTQLSDNNQISCPLCGRKFTRHDNFRRHMRNLHIQKSFRNQPAKRKSKSRKIVENLTCFKKSKAENTLDVTCNVCKKIFVNRHRMIRHKRYVHLPDEQKLTCNFCGRKFRRPDNIQNHIKRMHNKSSVIGNNNISELTCNVCKKPFANRWRLIRHERFAHLTEEEKLACKFCDRKFARLDNLELHMERLHRRHTGSSSKSLARIKGSERDNDVKIATCDVCKKTFASREKLIRHKRYVHLPEEEKITCKFCGRKFGRPDHFKNHMKRVHHKKVV